MEKTLELIFTKSDGAKKTLSIADPREDVTLAAAGQHADALHCTFHIRIPLFSAET